MSFFKSHSMDKPTKSSDDQPDQGNLVHTLREPRVLHGHTLTREITFRKVCEAIRDTAFVNSDLPLIVSFEVHTNLEQQAMMVEIMKETWRGLLVDTPPSVGPDTPLPPPGDLRKKILIKVKYTPPEKAKQIKKQEQNDKSEVDAPSPSSSEDESDGNEPARTSVPSSAATLPPQPSKVTKKAPKKKKKKKMLDELSQLGVYTRSYHFSSFTQPEAKIPTHIFSLSESAFLEAHENSPAALFHHNKHFFLRAYPKGLRVSSSNLNPAPFWRYGVQIAALNWQRGDKAIMLNEGMFAGTGGWVLKPPAYLSRNPHQPEQPSAPGASLSLHPTTQSTASSTEQTALPATLDPKNHTLRNMNLTLTLLCAQNLPLPSAKSNPRSFRPYIKIILHTESLTLDSSASSSSSASSKPSRNNSPSRASRGASSARQKTSSLLQRASSKLSRSRSRGPNTREPPTAKPLNERNINKQPAKQTKRKGTPRPRLKARSPTAPHHGPNPDWSDTPAVMRFAGIPVDEEALCFVRFKVMDDVELRRDEVAGWACVRLDRLREGYRVMSVFDSRGQAGDGRVLVRIQREWVDEGGAARTETSLPVR